MNIGVICSTHFKCKFVVDSLVKHLLEKDYYSFINCRNELIKTKCNNTGAHYNFYIIPCYSGIRGCRFDKLIVCQDGCITKEDIDWWKSRLLCNCYCEVTFDDLRLEEWI